MTITISITISSHHLIISSSTIIYLVTWDTEVCSENGCLNVCIFIQISIWWLIVRWLISVSSSHHQPSLSLLTSYIFQSTTWDIVRDRWYIASLYYPSPEPSRWWHGRLLVRWNIISNLSTISNLTFFWRYAKNAFIIWMMAMINDPKATVPRWYLDDGKLWDRYWDMRW